RDVSNKLLVNQMVGREVNAIYPAKANPDSFGSVVLELNGVSSINGKIRDVSLTVRKGEIVALAGLAGAGKGDVLRVLAGVEKMKAGTVRVGDLTTAKPTARQLISQGVGY